MQSNGQAEHHDKMLVENLLRNCCQIKNGIKSGNKFCLLQLNADEPVMLNSITT